MLHGSRVTLVLKGFCMGTADVIPGVSGGTMAFILGIYSELLSAIKSFDLIWLKSLFKLELKIFVSRPHIGFLIPLGIGIGTALLFFTRVVPLPALLQIYPEQIYGLFFGLIAGSIVILLQDMLALELTEVVPLILGLLIGFLIFNMVPVQTPESAWFIFLYGSLAICAMILPGISGSFILLILNKYAYIFNAIGYFQLTVLIPFALGAVTGLVLFSRILSYLISKYYRNTVLFIIGILVASLWVIWPFQERVYITVRGKARLIDSIPALPTELSLPVILSIGMIVTGFLLVLTLNRFAVVKVESSD